MGDKKRRKINRKSVADWIRPLETGQVLRVVFRGYEFTNFINPGIDS